MKFYSSPTKTLKPIKQEGTDPFFPKETKKLINELQTLDLGSLKKFYRASDKIVIHQYQNLKNPSIIGPAGWVYQGEAFRNLDIQTANQDYLRNHLIIGSALYGITTIDTQIIDHRLDFMKNLNGINLIDYWKPHIHKQLKDEVIVNVASNEFRQLIDGLNIIDIIFLDDNQVKSTYAKAARGLLLRECAKLKIKDVQELKALNILDYQFDATLSDNKRLYFTR